MSAPRDREVLHPQVTLLVPDGTTHTLGPGDLIGRLWTAALRIDHPRLSEAHAMVSLRNGELQLLRLRGMLRVAGERVAEVALDPGLRVDLADGVWLEVLDVDLPDEVLVLACDGGSWPLLGPIHSLFPGSPALVHRHDPTAAAWVWGTGTGYALALPGRPAAALGVGDEWDVAGRHWWVESTPHREAALPTTVEAGLPLRLVCRFDLVEIHRAGRPPARLAGTPARLVSELAALGGIADWQVIAREVCGAGRPDEQRLRRRLDKNLWSLRRKLAELGVRPDLVQTTGTGLLHLALAEGDSLVSQD